MNPQVSISPQTPLQFFFEGDDFFSALQTAIRGAVQSIDVEFYFIASDALGWSFAELLFEKAREGVRIRLIVDAVGCRGTSLDFFDALEGAGIPYQIYNPVLPYWRNLGRRNHRKVAIVDGKMGFLGGYNLAVEYSRKYSGEKGWRDSGVQITQPHLVVDLQKIFEDSWQRRHRSFREFLRARRRPPIDRGSLHIVPNYGRGRRSLIRREYLRAVRHAQKSVDITNPYFIPDRGILRALRQAARRGVLVRILTAGETDVRVARWAGQATYFRLLKAGARIFEYQGRVLHAKSAVVDGEWFTVGTANIDHLSFFKNLEVNLFGRNAEAARTLNEQFERDLQSSLEIRREYWRKRSWLIKLREKFFFWFREYM